MFTPEEVEARPAQIERERPQRDMDAIDVYKPELGRPCRFGFVWQGDQCAFARV